LPTGIVDTFTYNGDGQRVQKQDSTGTTKHVWDGQNILLETNASNIIQVVYTLEPNLYGNLISQRRSGTTSFYLFDGMGSTRQLASNTGSVTDSYLYDSFGNILLTSGSTTNWFRYVGKEGYYYDIDLLKYYLRARVYDPASARFLSSDPVRSAYEAPSQYTYVGNRPTVAVDPSGLIIPCTPCPVKWIATPWLGVTWQYGCYCGKGQAPGGPTPIDPTDTCCQEHDAKCGAAKTRQERIKANQGLCNCAKNTIAMNTCAASAPNIACCCLYARRVAALFCGLNPPDALC